MIDNIDAEIFKYPQGHRFKGNEVDLVVARLNPADDSRKGWVPAYTLNIVLAGSDQKVGELSVRVGDTAVLVKYSGHIGYRVDEAYRGHHYASKACLLTKPIFQAHGIDVIWITCNPDNRPSRKTCEHLGCELVEIVDLPPENDMYLRGERQKCRYRWIIF